MTVWEVDIYPAGQQVDRLAEQTAATARDLGLAQVRLRTAHGYLLEGDFQPAQVQQAAARLLTDQVVEHAVVARVGEAKLASAPEGFSELVHVLPKPGVMDPVAQSAAQALQESGLPVCAVRTLKKYWFAPVGEETLSELCQRVLANDSIEQVIRGPLQMDRLQVGAAYQFEPQTVAIRELNDDALMRLSSAGQLYLTLVEMQTIQQRFRELERDPTDAELESLAQTWSEHCSHKTLAGRIAYRDEQRELRFENMLKETIFQATQTIRKQLGDDDWCISVFQDNAGVVTFDEDYHVVFKVETHNHPSALEPYGGANTGIGGVIRDPLGTGMGAKPICNTDVFCFAPPDTPAGSLPPGVLHPRRVMQGVVAGVRDYGNRMGIPTVNGAIFFDPRYLGNPLVYCGNVGILPRDKAFKEAQPGDWVVAVGGRTGRDGIHGATFSSAELTSESESLSGGAVQIGNAITEKMLMDVVLAARDRGLYHAITDCGAGGFSSAVGEMGEHIGAEVWLDHVPLKYEGLSYTEIWISEAQERMVLSVSPEQWTAFHQLCAAEDVEATIIGRFEPTGRLVLKYQDQKVADLSMDFLHNGRPPVVRDAVYSPPAVQACSLPVPADADYTELLQSILGSLNVCSKEWVIRQYDHEVQAGSVLKPLVGIENDGPGDAAVVRPRLDSYRGLVISCGMNPRYGDFDTYHMAASAIDEAIRNAVAVGADPSRIAILDNFCWGYTDRPETLGSLVRAALACHDLAITLRTPFISGKDSLNNEFSFDDHGQKKTISIPPSLLISAMGQVDDVRRCVSMDAKAPGNQIFVVGTTHHELGGSQATLIGGQQGGQVPQVDGEQAAKLFAAVHRAIQAGTIRSCHDLSEGGLAVAAAEMAFAGGLGMDLVLDDLPHDVDTSAPDAAAVLLFSESNTRFLCEVEPGQADEFCRLLDGIPRARLGTTSTESRLTIQATIDGVRQTVIQAELSALKSAWQTPLNWS